MQDLMPVLAHYGGIDEVGIFLIPAMVAIYFLRRTEKKAREREAQQSTSDRTEL